jgi:DNA-binding transcriptional regulator YdaS (Cro superfamily)
MSMEREPGLEVAIRLAGSMRALARALGLSHQAIVLWRNTGKIPANHIIEIERITGLPRKYLRPDLYAPRDPEVAAQFIALTQAGARLLSLGLQHGVPWEVIRTVFEHEGEMP